jgi:hypothetical protein
MIFDWFNKTNYSNVVKFPEVKTPYIEPPKQESKARTYYTFGFTDDNRMAFTMGYTTLTMNREGIQGLIDQLEFFKNQLREEEDE